MKVFYQSKLKCKPHQQRGPNDWTDLWNAVISSNRRWGAVYQGLTFQWHTSPSIIVIKTLQTFKPKLSKFCFLAITFLKFKFNWVSGLKETLSSKTKGRRFIWLSVVPVSIPTHKLASRLKVPVTHFKVYASTQAFPTSSPTLNFPSSSFSLQPCYSGCALCLCLPTWTSHVITLYTGHPAFPQQLSIRKISFKMQINKVSALLTSCFFFFLKKSKTLSITYLGCLGFFSLESPFLSHWLAPSCPLGFSLGISLTSSPLWPTLKHLCCGSLPHDFSSSYNPYPMLRCPA